MAEEPTLRYVVLRHEGIEAPHFDLLFESKLRPELISCRLAQWPPGPMTLIQRIADHRRVYLEYEGPISGDRGTVSRIAAGTCAYEVEREDNLLLTLDSGMRIRIPRAQ